MGLFSKKKVEPKVPVGPPVGEGTPSLDFPPMSEEEKNLSPPPMPGGMLEDVKGEISSMPEKESESFFDLGAAGEQEGWGEETHPMERAPYESSELFSVEPSAEKVGEEPSDFISSTDIGRKKHISDTYFATTGQFKALLEIIDLVKSKVKSSAETHLRLLDIKSEEDIEYENLRKNFQFIEDKLYDIDGIIFEK